MMGGSVKRVVLVLGIATALLVPAWANERDPFSRGTPWKSHPTLSFAGTPLSIYNSEGNAKSAGTVRDWLSSHDRAKNDCSVTDTVPGKRMWIVCVRRGLYGSPPHKLVFVYHASVVGAGYVLINFATTDGNPLLGRDLIDHFRDEVEDYPG